MPKRLPPILAEVLLVICTIAIIIATWLPIDGVRHWLERLPRP